MGKRITRRVVLGTTIAGLAAGPFLIRAFRDKNNVWETDMSDTGECPVSEVSKQFFSEWKSVHESMSGVLRLATGPKTMSIKHDFSFPRSLSFRSLETLFNRTIGSLQNASVGTVMRYTLMEGTIEPEDGEPSRLRICVNKNEMRYLGIDFEVSRKNGAEITENKVKNPDGTVSTVREITPSFSYDSEARRYTANIENKIEVLAFPVGHFLYTRNLLPDRMHIRELSQTSEGENIISLSGSFVDMIRFPLPAQEIVIGRDFEFAPGEYMSLRAPLYRAKPREWIECNGFNTVRITPEYAVDSLEYGNFMRNLCISYLETQNPPPNNKHLDWSKHFLEERIRELSKRIAVPPPETSYFVDPQLGCIVRREECDTRNDDAFVFPSAVQTIFQLSQG